MNFCFPSTFLSKFLRVLTFLPPSRHLFPGDSEPMQFVPPSVAQRQRIAETLAAALPGVQHGQVQPDFMANQHTPPQKEGLIKGLLTIGFP